jgi:hypothetical protein
MAGVRSIYLITPRKHNPPPFMTRIHMKRQLERQNKEETQVRKHTVKKILGLVTVRTNLLYTIYCIFKDYEYLYRQRRTDLPTYDTGNVNWYRTSTRHFNVGTSTFGARRFLFDPVTSPF